MNLPRSHTPLAGEALSGVVALDWEDVLRGAADRATAATSCSMNSPTSSTSRMDAPAACRCFPRQLPALGCDHACGVGSSPTVRERRCGERPDPYGATNRAEFFAVATEAFFERPDDVRAEYPQLYQALREFYGQDPGRLD